MASLNSQDRLNLIVTPAAFRSIGDLYCFFKMVSVLPDKARRSISAGFSRGMMKVMATSREKTSTLYRWLLSSQHLSNGWYASYEFKTNGLQLWICKSCSLVALYLLSILADV